MSKKSDEYWEKRKARRMYEHMNDAEKCAQEMAKANKRALEYIGSKLEDIYPRIAREEKLSDLELARLKNLIDDTTSLDDVMRVLQQNPEYAKLVDVLNSSAYVARINRLKELQSQVDDLMTSTYKQQKKSVTDCLKTVTSDAYYKTIFDTQQRTGLSFSFATIDEKQLGRIINQNWSGANYSKRLWDNTQKTARKMKECLVDGVLTGKTEREMVKELIPLSNQGETSARRLVRTEACYAVNEAEMEAYEECEVERYKYIATLDSRTSEACRELDNKIFKVDERAPNKNCPPMHPWCRSTTIAYIDDEALDGMERRSRNPYTSKTERVSADLDYKTWYDKVLHDRCLEKLNIPGITDKIPETLEEFQKILYTKEKGRRFYEEACEIVPQYEIYQGDASLEDIVGYHKESKRIRANFPSGYNKRGTIAFVNDGRNNYWAYSGIKNANSKPFVNYKDKNNMPEGLAFELEERAFTTYKVGTWDKETKKYLKSPRWDRKVDAEAKLFEHLNKKIDSGDSIKEILMFVDNPMCPSCKMVLMHFKKKYPNMKINIVMKRKE